MEKEIESQVRVFSNEEGVQIGVGMGCHFTQDS